MSSREKVSRLRQLLSEATPVAVEPRKEVKAETEAWRRFQNFESYQAPAPLESDWRGVAAREITRIAGWYGWTSEIQRVLDQRNSLFLSSLADDDLRQLLDRMKDLEDCVQQGLGAPDAPPAM
ncbi:hypothetical protein [Stenotrophomonas sp. CFBP8994]|uniref:hypothetical protein n=1 Tax=Stenotrophomonas sp. CFBP8994 TaxID=3096527 RepID=UPI002A6AB0E6|nr:hypothetical protein [Stenotrophomonas sp. CFBP8994]MDY0978957.1 hypothetical protein [Stenotrophomonas sp. CFBP8994]